LRQTDGEVQPRGQKHTHRQTDSRTDKHGQKDRWVENSGTSIYANTAYIVYDLRFIIIIIIYKMGKKYANVATLRIKTSCSKMNFDVVTRQR